MHEYHNLMLRKEESQIDSTKDLLQFRHCFYNHNQHSGNNKIETMSPAGLQSRMPYLQQLVQRHFPSQKDSAILDLGCGYGALMHVLNLAGYTNVRGIDASTGQVRAAQRLGVKNVEQGDLIAFLNRIDDNSLDVVVAFDVIEHFTKPELLAIIKKVRKILKPSGRWIIHTPNGESPFHGRVRYGDITHETIFTRSSLTQLLSAVGFRDINCFEDCPIPRNFKSLIRYLLWVVFRTGLVILAAIDTGNLDRQAIFSQNFTTVTYR
jgi:2-polyprenyl-3-methyl-5-hydroxy-6-metoxy-1,4-benzoquinol methylase